MKRHCIAVVASACALAVAPSVALAGNGPSGTLGALVKQTQTATNQNTTEQSASSEASSQQTNINAPISILSSGSNDGAVNQSNEGKTTSAAGNANNTEQENGQEQNGSAGGSGGSDHGQDGGGGTVEQSQKAENSNKTNQQATSSASNEQTNINAPVSILSRGSNDGGVEPVE